MYFDYVFCNNVSGVRIIVVIKIKGNGLYRGKMIMIINNNWNNGIVCLLIFCELEVFLMVEKNGKYFVVDKYIFF